MNEELHSPIHYHTKQPPESLQELIKELRIGSTYTPAHFLLSVATHVVNTCKSFGELNLVEASKAAADTLATIEVSKAALLAIPKIEENGLSQSVISTHLEEVESYLRLTGDSLTEDKVLLQAAQEQAKIAASTLEEYLPKDLKSQLSTPKACTKYDDLLNSEFGSKLREELTTNLERATKVSRKSQTSTESPAPIRKVLAEMPEGYISYTRLVLTGTGLGFTTLGWIVQLSFHNPLVSIPLHAVAIGCYGVSFLLGAYKKK